MLRAGFIGFGRMGITHFSILNTHPCVETVSVCDSSSTMLNVLKKYAAVETYTDYRKMINNENLDLVIISTPTDSHSEILNFAIENGIHVFVEKPFAMTIADGQETLKRLGDKRLVNQVGYVNRFNEVFIEVKKLLNAGLIGEVKHFSSEMYGATVLKDSKGSWRGRSKSGGGCMYEFASHSIDLVVYLKGVPDKISGSIMQSIFSSSVEDLVCSAFRYSDGCIGHIIVNWSDETYRKPTNVVKFLGTKGKIQADKHAYKIFLKDPNKTYRFSKGWNTRYITDFAKSVRFYVRGNEFTSQLDYFIDHIEQGETANVCSFSEAFKTDILMENIREDAVHSMQTSLDKDSVSHSKAIGTKPISRWRRFVKRGGVNA
jgi:predicted dehydrogenase